MQKRSNKKMLLNNLPNDALKHLSLFLDPLDIVRLSVCSKRMNARLGNDRRRISKLFRKQSVINSFYLSIKIGSVGLVKTFIKKGASGDGMQLAAQEGHLHLVEFFIRKEEVLNEELWNRGLVGAAQGGHLHIVKFFIENGAKDLDSGMEGACFRGYMHVVRFLAEKGAKSWNRGIEIASVCRHLDLVDFFLEKGAGNLNHILRILFKNPGHLKVINFCLENGVEEYEGVCYSRILKTIKLFIEKGGIWNGGVMN